MKEGRLKRGIGKQAYGHETRIGKRIPLQNECFVRPSLLFFSLSQHGEEHFMSNKYNKDYFDKRMDMERSKYNTFSCTIIPKRLKNGKEEKAKFQKDLLEWVNSVINDRNICHVTYDAGLDYIFGPWQVPYKIKFTNLAPNLVYRNGFPVIGADYMELALNYKTATYDAKSNIEPLNVGRSNDFKIVIPISIASKVMVEFFLNMDDSLRMPKALSVQEYIQMLEWMWEIVDDEMEKYLLALD
jgi:hypothetical protein